MKVHAITTVMAAFLLFAVFASGANARLPMFSLSLENSFVTGAVVMKGEPPTDYDFDDNIMGGQFLLTFRYHLNDNFSVGVGSGVHINRLNASYEFWGTNHFSVPMLYVPIFAELRGTLPINDLISVYASSKIGGALAPMKLENKFWGAVMEDYLEGGFLIEPMLGVIFDINKIFLDAGVGYRLQTSEYVSYYRYDGGEGWDEPEEEETDRYPFNLHQFTVKVGIGFRF